MSVMAEHGSTELLYGHIWMIWDYRLTTNWLVLKEGEQYGEPTSNESEGLSLFDR